MRERLRFLLLYYCFWVVVFLFARILFLTYHIDETKDLTLELLFGIFYFGFKMDLAMAAYYSIFPFLWVTFSNFLNKSVFQNTIFSYTFILLTITNFIVVSDLEVYNIWNFRLDSTPLKFLNSPKAAYISLKNSPILRLLISYIFILAVGSIVVYRIVANKIYDWKRIKNFPFIIYGLLMCALLILPLRGGWGKTPLRQSTVYFSKNAFANASALNAPWVFFSSLLKKASIKDNPYIFYPREMVERTLDSLFAKGGTRTQLVNHKKPHILLISVENLSANVLDFHYNGEAVTPFLNELKGKSVYFPEVYAASDRTDKNVVSLLSGYPALPKQALIEFSEKIDKIENLSSFLSKNGYATHFYYGGEPDFLGLRSYLFEGDFEKISLKDDFGASTGLGAPDSLVYARVLADLKNLNGRPVYTSVFSLSTHEPYSIPVLGKWNENSSQVQYYNSLNYADMSLKNFLEEAQKEDWWKNTLVIIIGNRGHKWPEKEDKTAAFRVPMFWTGGVIKDSRVIHKVMNQSDLCATVLGQLSLSDSPFKWSKNVLDSRTPGWGFYVFNDGFGYIGKEKVVYDNVGRILLQGEQGLITKSLDRGKVLMQATYQDFLNL
ncbi:LTA synthase family protein [Leadbetterella byssophila]|uniref:LTA synthase family protein n=1 Tax=Leadbetterella byssophila TaxID=316068 RepID=UPI00399F923B